MAYDYHGREIRIGDIVSWQADKDSEPRPGIVVSVDQTVHGFPSPGRITVDDPQFGAALRIESNSAIWKIVDRPSRWDRLADDTIQ